MSSSGHQSPRNPSTPPQSIPLQDLARPPDSSDIGEERGHTRGRSILSGSNSVSYDTRYERLGASSPSPTSRNATRSDNIQTPGLQAAFDHGRDDIHSPVDDPHAFQAAIGFAGLSMPANTGEATLPERQRLSNAESFEFETISPYSPPITGYSNQPYFESSDSDRIPLTDANFLQPAVSNMTNTTRASQERSSFQSVRFNTPSPRAGCRLGDDLSGQGEQRPRGHSFGASLSPSSQDRRSRSNTASESPFSRAGSIMRAMSQRVVNLSNEAEPDTLDDERRSSFQEDEEEYPPIDVMAQDTAYHPGHRPSMQQEKGASFSSVQVPPPPPWPSTNPFRGKSLGLFAPDNPVRIMLCNFIVHPATEPAILILIVVQMILLAIDASHNVYEYPRPETWGGSKTDWALLGLFIVFTFEITARIIVSGLFFNAAEYSTVDRKKGLKNAVLSKYQMVFGPDRHHSTRTSSNARPDQAIFQPSIVRAFTTMNANISAPATAADFRRAQLARRAFLRHSLTRMDFIAIVAFWVSFILGIFGIEHGAHLYVFRMLSCLRIMRLLALTSGTSVILKSLKKAAPMLVNVSFLIGFFWLLFAIIGVQAFKSSFDRQCLWIDPLGVSNYTNTGTYTLCGGYLDNSTGAPMPWLLEDGYTNGSGSAKGYLCPRGSVCQQGQSLYNGTVSFDNIVQSIELVFVIMSANTFTDLMYYTTNSDYLAAALFFAAGIVIMMLWMTNLLIAVITSSFQVIREESKSHSAFTRNSTHASQSHVQQPQKPNMIKRWYDKTYWVWILVITYGLICQATRSASMSAFRESFINISEVVVTFILLGEIIMRLVADPRHFHKNAQNLVDLGIAVITTVILLPPIRQSGQPYAWLTFFQIIRIYRVIWAVPITRKLIEVVLGNAAGIGNLVLFVFLITFLVAILACQLFRGAIPPADENGNEIHITFFTLWNAFIGMYQILSSENWTLMLYNVTTYQNYLNVGWIGATFLIGWFILAYFILVNMFIAVIQENFDVSEDEKRLQQVKAFLQRKDESTQSSSLALSSLFRLGRTAKTRDPLEYGQATMEMLLKDAVVRDFLDEDVTSPQRHGDHIDSAVDPEARTVAPQAPFLPRMWAKFVSRVWHREPNPFYTTLNIAAANATLDARAMAKEALTHKTQQKRAQREFLARHPKYNKALFIFNTDNPIRRFCQTIVGPGRMHERVEGVEPNKIVWYTFSAFIYACIVTMVVLACVTTPLYQREYFANHVFTIKNWFVWTDLAFAGIFTIEAVIKVIADGFFWTPNAYFRSLWGFIDGMVLITLWVNVAASFVNDGAVSRAVGAFKALRALRLLNVSDSARETFHSVIFVGGWRVLSAAFVSLSLLIPFAIYGVNLFNGLMMTCNDTTGDIFNLSDCAMEYGSSPYNSNWTLLAPRVASNPYYDFDNFGDSLFILFQIVSQEGWTDVMWSAESIIGKGFQPQNFASQGHAVFFIIFNLMATAFVLNLFISVFMRTYTEQTGVAFLTSEQRSWLELRKLLDHVRPSKRPSNKLSSRLRLWCYKRATQKHGKWHQLITILLVFHLILLTMEFYPEPAAWDLTRNYIFLALTAAYIANIMIRIVGLSWPRFRRSSWDIYSLLSVSGTLITTILLLSNFNQSTYVRLHKLFLVSIALLLIPRNNALDQLFKTAAASLSKIGNLLATWFVLFLVFAIAMTQTFGLTRFGANETNNLNFRTVPKALIVLFRMSVGEGWNQIMEDFATIEPPFCTEDPTSFFNSDCGSDTWARALFIAWNILSMYLFVSLFVSLIYESFSYVYQRSSGLAVVTREEMRRFKQAWSVYDPAGTGYISKEQFPRLLGELSGIFGMRIYDEQDSVHRILEDIQTQSIGNRASSIATTSAASGIDLHRLNERIARINSKDIKERRNRYNMFYQEVMVSADPDRGIAFNQVLMILAHYNVIMDSKSLK